MKVFGIPKLSMVAPDEVDVVLNQSTVTLTVKAAKPSQAGHLRKCSQLVTTCAAVSLVSSKLTCDDLRFRLIKAFRVLHI